MSREHNDGIDAIRYATEAWRKTRDELLSCPTYRVQSLIDKNQPLVSEMVEKELRRQLLEGIADVLYDGEYHVVRILRKEEFLHLLPTTRPYGDSEARVTYQAEITEVQHRHYQVADVCKLSIKSTGRNHRKKDRAKARRLRAERKKLAARLKNHE